MGCRKETEEGQGEDDVSGPQCIQKVVCKMGLPRRSTWSSDSERNVHSGAADDEDSSSGQEGAGSDIATTMTKE